MDGHPTATTFRLLDLPSEVVYAVGVAAEIKDAIALSATCRRLRAHLASLVWLRVKFSINSSRRPHYILTLNPYLKEHRETLNLIKEATITSHHLDVGPYLVQERSEDATFARTIRAMTSLRSLSLDVKGLCYLQIELLIFELRTEPRFELQFLELRSKKACRALIECFGTNLKTLSLSEGPDSYGFKAASKSFKHLESLWIKTAEVFEEVKPFPLIDDRVLTQIAEAFPQLKSLALRETLPVDCYLFTPHRSTDKITTDSTKLGKVLREKLPNLQRFVCTMDLIDLGSLVHYLSRIRAFLNLAIRDHPALNEMMILLDRMHLVRWERDSNWISLERCLGPLLLGPASKVAQAMRETRLLKKIPLDSCGELRALE